MARAFFKNLKLSRQSAWFQALVPGGSIACCLIVAFIFWVQPDAFAAVLVLPRWLWIVPGLLLAVLGWTRERKRVATVAAALWLLYTLCFLQELRSLIRFHHSLPEAVANRGGASTSHFLELRRGRREGRG